MGVTLLLRVFAKSRGSGRIPTYDRLGIIPRSFKFLCAAFLAFFAITASQGSAGTTQTIQTVGAESQAQQTTVEQVFDDMRKAFRPDVAKGVHARYQFRFKEPQSGDWWITVDDGKSAMGRGVIDKPDVTFSCSGADWVALSNGTLSGIRAFFTGRLHVNGSQRLAHKLDDMFP